LRGEKGISLFFYWQKKRKENFRKSSQFGGFSCQLPGKKREKIARLVYLVPISNQKFRRMIKNLCFISGLQPDLAKILLAMIATFSTSSYTVTTLAALKIPQQKTG
jgi:hypothetical protein